MHAAMRDDKPLWTLSQVFLGPARLESISLSIEPGVTVVLGWSGAGKTSLLNVLVGFEKPERGILDGPKSLYWSPQNHGLWPHCTAREHLELVRCAEWLRSGPASGSRQSPSPSIASVAHRSTSTSS